jgi:hypothetical protein
VANFLLKKAFSLELINFSKVFHLKIQKIFLAFSSQKLLSKISNLSFSFKSLKLFFSIKS